MPFYPKLAELGSSRLFTDTFYGYNHNLKIADGEFYDMKNLTGDYYPVMSQRKRRGIGPAIGDPQGLLAKEALAYVDGDTLYYNGNAVPYISLSPSSEDHPKQLVSMGAYLCVFPDGVYVNTQQQAEDHGSMGAVFQTAEGSQVTFSICDKNAAVYENVVTQATAPTTPTNGAYWIDNSGSNCVLRQYSETSAMWVDVPTVYVKISYTGIGTQFAVYDGVTISGCLYSGDDPDFKKLIEALNASAIIYAKDADYIVVVGLISQPFQQTTQLTVERKVPKMDYVTESNNRLWGCYYGIKDGKAVNEIYSCKLGDFKNWSCFMGISTDSYAVTLGTDGPFTGAIAHLGYPLFFKENCIHKIYGTFPSDFQVLTIDCRGVQQGSYRSLQIVNETLFYKSRTDVCTFDGSLPASVSLPIGTEQYDSAVAGAIESKYYISMRDRAEVWHLFVFDAVKGLWYREDNTHALFFAKAHDDLFYIDAGTNKLISVNGTQGDAENDLEWEAVTGVIGYEYPDHKYLSRFSLRMNLSVGSSCDLYAMYDSSGSWVHMAHMDGRGTDTFTLPVRPRRCDHMQLKLSGVGGIKLYNIAKIIELGSDI